MLRWRALARLPPRTAPLPAHTQYVRLYMRPAEVASLLSSAAYLGARPDERVLSTMLRDMQNMYTDATGDDLANIAMAIAQFQFRPA